MTDRKLLELAAKAAGIKVKGYFEDEPTLLIKPGIRLPPARWNPLTDDGDALRLAVKLGMDLELHGALCVFPFVCASANKAEIQCEEEAGDNDPYAATRRAIVMAAAEIGAGK